MLLVKEKKMKVEGSYDGILSEVCMVLCALSIRTETEPPEIMADLAKMYFSGMAEIESLYEKGGVTS